MAEPLNASVDAFLKELAGGAGLTGGGGDHDHHHHHDNHAVAAAAAHDHHGHGGAHDHMMMMYFHGGWNEVILFDWWRIDSLLGLLLSSTLIFVMGTLYEGIKWFRVYLQMLNAREQCAARRRAAEQHAHHHHHAGGGGESNNGDEALLAAGEGSAQSSLESGHHHPEQSTSAAAGGHGGQPAQPTTTTATTCRLTRLLVAGGWYVQSALYCLQLVLAYWLMLIVMTYNSWLTAAVILGATFGHWLFALLKLLTPNADASDSFVTDACH